jgi:hypothetical protein
MFRRSDFGESTANCREALLDDCLIDFEEAKFKNGKLNFFKFNAKTISLVDCILNCYVDLRIDNCETIDLTQSIVQNIVDLNPGVTKMNIKELNLTGVRNMGDIFISWEDNNVLNLISNQKTTRDIVLALNLKKFNFPFLNLASSKSIKQSSSNASLQFAVDSPKSDLLNINLFPLSRLISSKLISPSPK